MLIDSQKLSDAIHALEAFRDEHGLTTTLRGSNPAIEEVLAQEEVIRQMLPADWSIEYEYPFYQINLYK